MVPSRRAPQFIATKLVSIHFNTEEVCVPFLSVFLRSVFLFIVA